MIRSALYHILLTLSSVHIVLGTSPFLSSPGNASILVFVDLHLVYHTNGSCNVPVWENLELAHSLLWKNQRVDEIGIEIYDTCGSEQRVLGILHQRLYPGTCNASRGIRVSGIISYTSPEISDVISGVLRLSDVIHVIVGEDAQSVPSTTVPYGKVYADLASIPNVEFLASILAQLGWRYVTTISDGDPVSLREHSMFLNGAADRNICVQYSQTPNSLAQLNLKQVKTPGVVIFTANVDSVDVILEQLPISTPVFVITHDRRTSGFRFIRNGMVMSDVFDSMADFSEYMANETTWNQTGLDAFTIEYYINKHNCTFNETAKEMGCTNIEDMRAHFDSISSSRIMNMFNSVYDLVLGVTNEMMMSNCSTFTVSKCFDLDKIKDISAFLGVDKGLLYEKPPYSISLTWIQGGQVQKDGKFSTYGTFDSLPDLHAWIDNVTSTFPSSQCTGWCPTCHMSTCDATSGLKFDGDYHYIPGDILIVGMFPFSLNWERSSESVCTGVSIQSNADIMSEAFMYAIKTFHMRYSDAMPNVEIGALVFDTCSHINRASQITLNFESCQYAFDRLTNYWRPSPKLVPAIVIATDETPAQVLNDISRLNKLGISVDKNGNIHRNNDMLYNTSIYDYDAVIHLLDEMDWTYAGVVTSSSMADFNLSGLYEMALSKNICIAYHSRISNKEADITNAIDTIRNSVANTIVLFAKADEINTFFRKLTSKKVIKTWIIIETRQDWLNIRSYPLPLGTLFLQRQGKQNNDFNLHLRSIKDRQTANFTNTSNPWLSTFKKARDDCVDCNFFDTFADDLTLMQASDVIKAVDIAMDAVYKAYLSLCTENNSSLCSNFWENGTNEVVNRVDDVRFVYQEETVRLSPRQQLLENYVIYNLQTGGITEVGRWTEQKLILQKNNVISYNSNFEPLSAPRDSYCFTSCVCANFYYNTSGNDTVTPEITLDAEMGYKSSSAEFEPKLWCLIVVIISGTGSLITIFLMVYIMCKVCTGGLVRRYLALGILLLVAMVFLFLSVLPFVFTPSEAVCGMRFFAHGFSYAFCFAIILTKMTTLRDYKYIGLGGEVSRINQLLSIFFITAIQVAIGVQWWVLHTPSVYTQMVLEQTDGVMLEKTYYACDFRRDEFIAYHSFVLFLIFVCCLYSISVRHEAKNMKEARLLFICSWFCLALWVAIIVTFFILDRDFLEAICAIGILANVLSMMVIIYLPKLSAISRLKYEVSEQNGVKENGYKVDTDFQFERPYSLPGTMHSSITDKTLSYPRSLTAFDTSMSY